MDTAHITYIGELRNEAVHVRSGDRIRTDAPVDNQGQGAAFSPTDLLCVALCTCILTTDRKSTRLNSSHSDRSRMPSSA